MKDLAKAAREALEQLEKSGETVGEFEDGFIVGCLTMKKEIERLKAEIKKLKQH